MAEQSGRVFAGGGAAGNMATSVGAVGSAVNQDRFSERSMPALRILNRYAAGATWRTGYATPFTTGVSMNPSGVPEGLGIIGHPQLGQAAVGPNVWPGNVA